LRAARPRPVDLEDAGEQLVASERADERAVAAETGALSERVGRVVREALEGMSVEDRMIIRFHFGSGMTIADISGLLRLPQRPLYRRVEALLRRLHAALEAAGIAAGDVRDLLGSATREIDFGLHDWKPEGKSDPGRQTNPGETTVREAG
jgi:DNA-directed RNA polymerase specialized sigma24 family protein